MSDYEIVKKMYALLFGAGDDALTCLDECRVDEAKEILRNALEAAEELYVSSET